jgi:hypothetical protein
MAMLKLYHPDGQLQCGEGEKIALDVIVQKLSTLIAVDKILKMEERVVPLVFIFCCGCWGGSCYYFEVDISPSREKLRELDEAGFKVWDFEDVIAALDGHSGPGDHFPWSNKGFGPGDGFPWGVTSDILGGDDALLIKGGAHSVSVESQLIATNLIADLSMASRQRTSIKDLVGLRCRVITPGHEPKTLEYIRDRANIYIDDKGRILDVAFF